MQKTVGSHLKRFEAFLGNFENPTPGGRGKGALFIFQNGGLLLANTIHVHLIQILAMH